jgi:hypothetical protein
MQQGIIDTVKRHDRHRMRGREIMRYHRAGYGRDRGDMVRGLRR